MTYGRTLQIYRVAALLIIALMITNLKIDRSNIAQQTPQLFKRILQGSTSQQQPVFRFNSLQNFVQQTFFAF